MPIPVVCASCQTRLNAPDAAAGKKVKCPKCQAVMAVPAAEPPPAAGGGGTPFDFGGGAPPPPPRRSAPPPPPEPASPPPPAAGGGGAFDFGAAVSAGGGGRSRGDREERGERGNREEQGDRGERGDRRRRRDEGDDAPPPDRGDRPRRRPRDAEDDAGDDDRPRGRRPDGEKKKSPLLLILLGGGFLLLTCCGGGGVVAYVAVGRIKEAAEKARAENDVKQKQIDDARKKADGAGGGLPAGWVKFEAPDKSVRAAFPGTPDDGNLTIQTVAVQSAKSWQYMESDGSLTCTLAVVKFRAKSKAADQERDLKAAAGLMNLGVKDSGPPRSVDWLGGQAKEAEGHSSLTDATVVTRSVVVGNTGYIAVVQHKNKADAVAAFFNSVEAPPK